MIKNEREYAITRASVKKFEKALNNLADLRKHSKTSPDKVRLQTEATDSILLELRRQITEYERPKAGKFELHVLSRVDQLPRDLIKARIALGWTQKDLAKRVGTTEQQIQKYEATNYEAASLRRVSEIAGILEREHGRAR